MNKKGRVVVGLSGGVDSSVAAYLLQKEGYDVLGVFMKNWHDTEVTISDECPWEEDSKDALLVADKLGIPFHTIDLSEEYLARIVNYMFAEYEAGRTPNPDVLCNREIKFDLFLKHAKKLGADFVATGHYCRKGVVNGGADEFRLLAGVDHNKDQSYFLCQVNQAQLKESLFPIGELEKSEVRAIAKAQGLITADKRDSQGLCFIGKVKLPDFLKQQLTEKEGNVVKVDSSWPGYEQQLAARNNYHYQESDGEIIGTHMGAHFYTIGQRKGLNIGGFVEPLFVIQINTQTNTVYVGEGENHPGLYRNGLFIKNKDIYWIRNDFSLKNGQSALYSMRIRYRQTLFNASLNQMEDGLEVKFETPQKAVAPGQFAAWYLDDELIGSGVIE